MKLKDKRRRAAACGYATLLLVLVSLRTEHGGAAFMLNILASMSFACFVITFLNAITNRGQ